MTSFFETLWIGNIEEVAQKINALLEGKKYTFAAVNLSRPHSHIEIQTDQCLKYDEASDHKAVHVWMDDEQDPPRFGGFHVNDTYGVWGVSTSQLEKEYDYNFGAPYIVIDHKTIHITQLNGLGEVLQWAIAVQGE